MKFEEEGWQHAEMQGLLGWEAWEGAEDFGLSGFL